MNEQENLAKQLHEWYLEACREPESGMDFNPAAQVPYGDLREAQKFLDRYIAGKITELLARQREEVAKRLTERAEVPNNLIDLEVGKVKAIYLRDALSALTQEEKDQ